MAIITNILMSAQLTNFVGKALEALYQSIGNFGWTVVVFTIILRVILAPLDAWQRISSRKQQKKMAALKPKMEKLEKQYGRNPDVLKQKQYELQREAQINVFSSCLPLIVTMVVFFVVFGGFRALVVYENEKAVEKLDAAYVEYILDYNYDNLTPEQQAECEDIKDDFVALKNKINTEYNLTFVELSALKAADEDAYNELNTLLADTYEENIEGWLWIKNVFKSDIGTDVVPDLNAYVSAGAGGIGASLEDTNIHASYSDLVSPAMARLNKSGVWDFKKWNGYFILPILSLITSFFSTFLMQKAQPQTAVGTKEQLEQQQKTMKYMNYLMPFMLAMFAIMYSAAFAIYYFASNLIASATTLGFNLYYKQKDKKEASDSSLNA